MLRSTVAVYQRRFIAHYSQAMGQCNEGVALLTTPQWSGNVLKEIHCPLLFMSQVVNQRRPFAHTSS